MKPSFVTFTGADDETSIETMQDLSARYPIEWGILFSPSRQGVDPRYPGIGTLERLFGSGLQLAAHLCGDHARDIMGGRDPLLPVPLTPFARIQINHVAPDPGTIAAYARRIGKPCIAQARGESFPDDDRILWLFDVSGGRGIAPKAWPRHPGRLVGYAGSLGPSNSAAVVREIGPHATAPYWLDMESGVRTDDRFDLGLVGHVCSSVYQ